MKVFLDQAVQDAIESSTTLHNDLLISHKGYEEDKKARLDKNFKESETEKFKRLT